MDNIKGHKQGITKIQEVLKKKARDAGKRSSGCREKIKGWENQGMEKTNAKIDGERTKWRQDHGTTPWVNIKGQHQWITMRDSTKGQYQEITSRHKNQGTTSRHNIKGQEKPWGWKSKG